MTLAQPDTTPALSIERWSATSGSERGSRASLVLHGGGHRWRAHADGNGAVDALMRAVDDALAPLLGTGVQVAPISSIDERPVGSGEFPISLDIQRRYFAAVRGSDERYAYWLTPI